MATATPYLEEDTESMTARVVEEICALLGRRRIRQSDLARMLDKTPVWVSERLNGKTRISVDDMALIAAALKVHMVDLLPRPERQPVTTQLPPDRAPRAVPDVMSFMPRQRQPAQISTYRTPLPDVMTLPSVHRGARRTVPAQSHTLSVGFHP